MSTESGTTRRSALLRGLLLAAGAVGIGAGAGAAKVATDERAETAGTRTLRLYATELRVAAPAPGTAPSPAAPSGALLDGDLRPAGRFAATPFAGADGLQLHSFTLADGTILGLGSAVLEEGVHAIVGGTGRYAGAAGSYVARPAVELPGRSAEITVTFKAWEA
jgi:hypothetical protein